MLRGGILCIGLMLAAGAAQAQPAVVTCDEPGWNWVDVGISLTANQPTYWSAATGRGDSGGTAVSPFTILDPGPPPGRPTLDGTDQRVLRGFILAWAVDANGAEIRWNHLKGDVVIVNYDRGAAWEYSAYAFQAVDPAAANGDTLGTPGQLLLDGNEYDNGFDRLIFDFYAANAAVFGHDLWLDTELTLMPLDIDVRQETAGPTTTKASFTIWNQNEVKLTGLDRCVTCWDNTLLADYGLPNHFLLANLQTNMGKAQIDGLPSQLCDVDYDPGDGLALGADPRDVVSRAAALIGVEVSHFHEAILPSNSPQDDAGEHLVGMGTQSGMIQADILGTEPPERPVSSDGAAAQLPLQTPGDVAIRNTGSRPIARAAGDRLSASEKGSLLIFPKVELRWDGTGQTLLQDTFIDLTNDFPGDVQVQMYFVQGDAPFMSNGVDANTNGVADDCEDRLRWSCHVTRSGPNDPLGCRLNPLGPFASLADCVLNCERERYTCVYPDRAAGPEVGPNCISDPEGEYGSLEECEQGCGERYGCYGELTTGVSGGSFFCEIDSKGQYDSLLECQEFCGEPHYNCVYDEGRGINVGCMEDPFGPFTSPEECELYCGATRYDCYAEGRGIGGTTCYPSECGEYATFGDCVNSCGLRTYACGSSRGGGGGCRLVEDGTGEYLSLTDCAYSCPSHAFYTCAAGKEGGVACVPTAQGVGEFTTLESCEQCCSTRYTCGGNRGDACIPDPNGEYATYEECQALCGSRYECGAAQRSGVLECYPSPTGAYASLSDCQQTCGQNFLCTAFAKGAEGRAQLPCIPDANGNYATKGECFASCAITAYGCDGEANVCYPTEFGPYGTQEDCAYACIRKYSCAFDTNGGHCVADPNGTYTEQQCLEQNACTEPARPVKAKR